MHTIIEHYGNGLHLNNVIESVVMQSHVCLSNLLIERSQPGSHDVTHKQN